MKTDKANRKIPTGIALAACCGIFISSPTAQGGEKNAAENMGWRLGVQAFTFRALTFFETVDRAKQLGLKYIEMYPGQKLKPGAETKTGATMTDAENAGMLAKLREAGVRLVSFGVAPIPTDETGARQRFEWAKKMGIEVLVTESAPTELLDKLSGEYGVKIALHNHPTTWLPDQVLEATGGLSARIGACADIGHWTRGGLTPVECLKKLEGRIVSFHFKDVIPAHEAGKFDDVPWGTGQCDMRGVMAELKRQGFKGYLIIEYEKGGVEELMANLPKCIEFYNQAAADLAK